MCLLRTGSVHRRRARMTGPAIGAEPGRAYQGLKGETVSQVVSSLFLFSFRSRQIDERKIAELFRFEADRLMKERLLKQCR